LIPTQGAREGVQPDPYPARGLLNERIVAVGEEPRGNDGPLFGTPVKLLEQLGGPEECPKISPERKGRKGAVAPKGEVKVIDSVT